MAESAQVLLEISFETVVQKFSSPAARRVSFPDFTSKGVHILGFRVHYAAFELAYNSALCLIVIGAPPPVDSR